MYEKGLGLPLGPKKARELYESSCAVGDLDGCLGIALHCEEDESKDCNPADTLKLYEEACRNTRFEACSRLARIYIKGQWVEKDVNRGVAYAEQACKGGEADGCDALGEYYEKAIEKPDLVKASTYYRQACEGGSGKGCYHLGKMYQANRGPGADPAKAGGLFEKACNYGHGKSCLLLADSYMTGNGVPKDVKRALTLYEQGCQGGDGDSCYKIGESWQRGDQGTVDLVKAASYFEKACASEGYAGCYALGQMYEKGTGVQMDILKAASLYRRACNKGVEAACNVGMDIQFKAWFITNTQEAFENDICQIYGYDEENPENTRLIAKANKAVFDITVGPRKGLGLTATAGELRFLSGETYRGYGAWTLATAKGSLSFEHYVLWNTDEPIDALDGASVSSTDRKGKSTIVFNADDEDVGYVSREVENEKDQKCTFSGGFPMLNTSHCSAIQAIIAAQLLTECKGE